MSRVKTPKLAAEVRLRKWPAGRVSQLKVFLGHLEQAVGISLAAQVEQSPKRKFSEFVPKIVAQDITLESSYKELRVFWESPKGLVNLLFYEIQISATSGFFNFDQAQTPENFYVYPQLTEGTTYYVRLRVVNKHGEVGPWSDVEDVDLPYAQAYGLLDETERKKKISTANSNPWTTVYQRTYTAIGGKAYYAVDYEVSVQRTWAPEGAGKSGNCEWSDLEFKWMEQAPSGSSLVQRGQTFFTSTYSTNDAFGVSGFYTFNVHTSGYPTPLVIPGTWSNPRRGTFVQKFSEMEPGDYLFELQSRIIPDHSGFANDFYTTGGMKFVYGSDAEVKIKNFNIFETLVT
jgi:hypothetical protein